MHIVFLGDKSGVMQNVLISLGLQEVNNGCSTGLKWFGSGGTFESYSPVDGKLIAKVKGASKDDY
jgi:aldehyde dehydrogenase (NAD+)